MRLWYEALVRDFVCGLSKYGFAAASGAKKSVLGKEYTVQVGCVCKVRGLVLMSRYEDLV